MFPLASWLAAAWLLMRRAKLSVWRQRGKDGRPGPGRTGQTVASGASDSPQLQSIPVSEKPPFSPNKTAPLPRSPAKNASPHSHDAAMAEQEVQNLNRQLHRMLQTRNFDSAPQLLSQAKVALLKLNALLPSPQTPTPHLRLVRDTLELGALVSIWRKDADGFTRYFQQVQPFYALPASRLPRDGGNRSKITGLYLLLLLSVGDYAGFHTLLEALEVEAAEHGGGGGNGLEDDDFIQYPIRLEQALMEGAYDRVWGGTKGGSGGGGLPSEEFEVFSEVLIPTIRNEIASCSEKAYPSIPIANAKNIFYLDSEGGVVQFAHERGWLVKDGRLYFPDQQQQQHQQQHQQHPGLETRGGGGSDRDILAASGQVIENTLGYARELETIV